MLKISHTNSSLSNSCEYLKLKTCREDLFFDLPIGIIIIDIMTLSHNRIYRINYSNLIANDIFNLNINSNEISNLKESFLKFKKWENDKETSINLDNEIFDNINKQESSGIYLSEDNMIFIKYKYATNRILITADKISEDRKRLQVDLVKNLKYQYLLSLYHEINNPFYALMSLLEQRNEEDDDCDMRTANYYSSFGQNKPNFNKMCDTTENNKKCLLLLDLIKIYIKNFLLYVRVHMEFNNGINSNLLSNPFENRQLKTKSTFSDLSKYSSTMLNYLKNKTLIDIHIDLGYIFKKITLKNEKLLDYKEIKVTFDFSLLNKKIFVTNEYYLKKFINSIYIFIYSTVERKNSIKIKCKLVKSSNIIQIDFKVINLEKSIKITIPIIDEIEFLYKKNYRANTKIKSTEIQRDLLQKLSEILNIEININSKIEKNKPTLLSLRIPYYTDTNNDIEVTDENDYEEITKEQREKLTEAINRKNNINLTEKNNLFMIKQIDKKSSCSISQLELNEEGNKYNLNNYQCVSSVNNGPNSLNDDNLDNSNSNPNNIEDNMAMRNNLSNREYGKIIINSTEICESPTKIKTNYIVNRSFNDHTSNHIPSNDLDKSCKFKSMKNLMTVRELKDGKNNLRYSNNILTIENPYLIKKKLSNTSILSPISPDKYLKNSKKTVYTVSVRKYSQNTNQNSKSVHNVNSYCNNKEFDINKIKSFKNKEIDKKRDRKSFISIPHDPYNLLSKKNSIRDINGELDINNIKNNLHNTNKCGCCDILVCDDETFCVETVAKTLLSSGVTCDKCYNGKECLEKIKKKYEKNCDICKNRNYKLLILDINMPVMDGIVASKKIQELIDKKEIDDVIQIAIFSTSVDDKLKSNLENVKCVKKYLRKPVKKSDWKVLLNNYYFHKN